MRARSIAIVLGLLAIVAVTVIAWRWRLPLPHESPEDAWAVVRAAPWRPDQVASFAALRGVRDGVSTTSRLRLRAAAARLELTALESTAVESLRQAALAQVALGNAEECLALLALGDQRAFTADAWSDQAACHLSLAERSPLHAARALEASLAALNLDPAHLAGRNNLRQAYLDLGLPLTDADPGSSTTGALTSLPRLASGREARLWQASEPACPAPGLEPSLNRGDSDVLREWLLRCELTRPARTIASGQAADVTAGASRARALAADVARTSGDPCFVALTDAVIESCDSETCGVLASGWQAAMSMALAWDAGRQDLASARSPEVVAAFPALDSLPAAYAWIELAAVDRLEQRSPRAEQRLQAVAALARGRGCRHLEGRAMWPLALLRFERGDYQGALDTSATALPLLEETRDREAHAVLSNVTAGIHQAFDALEDAWYHAHRAVASLADCRHLRRQSVLTGTANLAQTTGLPRAAAFIRGIAVADAEASQNWTTLAFLLPRYATDLLAVSRAEDAAAALVAAEQALGRVADANTRELAFVPLAVAHAQVGTAHARERLRAAIASVGRRRMTFQLPNLLGLLAAQASVAGDREVARGSLDEAHRLLERQRRAAAAPSAGRAAQVQAWDLAVQVAEGHWRSGDSAAAYDLIEGMASPRRESADGGAIHLRFVVTSSRILAVGRGPDGPIRFEVGRFVSEVLADVGRLGRLMRQERRIPAVTALLERLFEDLIAPMRNQVARARLLVVHPHGELHDVPFAALIDRATGRHLIEDVAMQYGGLGPAPVGNRARAALLVAPRDPGDLPVLPHARDEIRQLASVYRSARTIQDDRGLADDLVPSLGQSSVFHFAGHALVNRTRPELSGLVLGRTMLRAVDIERLSLPRLELVVLSACRTASGLPAGRGGRMGLPAAFLHAGATAVVATQWEVSDASARDVAVLLHRHWAGGLLPAEALRRAQRDVLAREPRRPWTWASFMVVQNLGN